MSKINIQFLIMNTNSKNIIFTFTFVLLNLKRYNKI